MSREPRQPRPHGQHRLPSQPRPHGQHRLPSQPRPSGLTHKSGQPRLHEQRILGRAAVAVGCVGLGLACAALEVAFSTKVVPWLTEPAGVYSVPADIWRSLQPARWVANGAVLFLYESAGPRFDYGPLWPVVISPGVALGDHLNLPDSSLFGVPRPTMAIAMIMAAVTAVITALAAATWRITAPLANKTRLATIAAVVGPAMIAAGSWFHGEDILVVAFVLLAAASPATAAWWTAAALLTKQTMLAYAPALLAACEFGRRRGFVLVAAGIPAAFMAMIFAATPQSLIAGLTGAPTCAECFTPSLWASLVWDDPTKITATPGRTMWVGASAAAAWLWRHRCRDNQGLLAMLAAIALLRCLLFEAGVYAYYWVPAMIFALAWRARAGQRLWPSLLGFAGLTVWHITSRGSASCTVVGWHRCRSVCRVVPSPALTRSTDSRIGAAQSETIRQLKRYRLILRQDESCSHR